ncbi:hypothetical protein RDI58_020030 [Solanum bulbocastanum]|uniref:Uncharacterized protein n=1 Tax=Solanum bulbocastanum TaxID=147425 RepID=A0AAN8T6G2_SOLBU
MRVIPSIHYLHVVVDGPKRS